jgi:hypothetical protein
MSLDTQKPQGMTPRANLDQEKPPLVDEDAFNI